jgi:hypothetical protein
MLPLTSSSPTVDSPLSPHVLLDSGATGTFVAIADIQHLCHPLPISNGPHVLSASGDVMSYALCGILPLSPHLSTTAQSAFVLDDLRTGTLVSLAQLCDDDCVAMFLHFGVQILKHNTVLITGICTPNGLWSILLQVPSIHQANGILCLDSSREQLAVYHHATLGSLAPSTLLRAI